MIRPIIAQEKVEMMRVLVPLAEGFEEIEAISVIDILRRAEIEVVTAGLKDGLAEGSHKVKVLPDTTLEKVDWHDFDGLVLPGGAPGFVNLGNDQRILDMAREMNRAGKCVAAICAAPSVLIKAGVLQGRKATVSPSGKAQVQACADFREDRVVVDKNLITSRAPGTALEFALKLVEALAGREKMEQVKAQTMAIC
ncbi:MAG: DJ-1/PfpI family protein [Methanothrix sp.]|nr:DJ-1/PfpI family protein [Methanothrix sp.]MDD1741118.1 DJ-1/PfpI family protein [Methanothrix sp.]OYV10698.1 MAG: 4-methyl-5(b-hydroxyethyl)-thiazole monophosphate biosynthesi [Methanosaeta sp. NSP1]OYV13936.1 MAG: 4-methyl-5(b-hydroxyethyl)-thiazole monophosphate biosynthesi [Methanosaeta sp. ASO1]